MFLVRIASGAVLVAAELVTPKKTSLFAAAYTLQSAGLSTLLLSTIGFIGLVYVTVVLCQGYLSDASPIHGQRTTCLQRKPKHVS